MEFLQKGIVRISQSMRVMKVSSIYKSSPVDMKETSRIGAFYNICVSVDTDKTSQSLLEECKKIEREIGFEKSEKEKKIPRILDIDLIFHQTETKISNETIEIPHKEYKKRLFVLLPLLEIHPRAMDPQEQIAIREYYLQGDFSEQKCTRFCSWEKVER